MKRDVAVLGERQSFLFYFIVLVANLRCLGLVSVLILTGLDYNTNTSTAHLGGRKTPGDAGERLLSLFRRFVFAPFPLLPSLFKTGNSCCQKWGKSWAALLGLARTLHHRKCGGSAFVPTSANPVPSCFLPLFSPLPSFSLSQFLFEVVIFFLPFDSIWLTSGEEPV